MSSLHVKLFGGFEASDDAGAPLGPLGRKSQALLAILALNPGVAQPREKLMALLWSDRGESQARGSLRHALTELRKALAGLDPPPLIADRETVRIDPDAVAVDAVTFERLSVRNTVQALAQAGALYQGDLLDGFDARDAAFEEWLRTERERLRERAAENLTRLMERQTGGDAIVTGRRLLAIDPLNEAAHRALMRLYAEAGDRKMALRQYETCRELLQGELGLEPEAETERLLEDIRANTADRAARGRGVAPSTDQPRPLFDISGDKKVAINGGCLCGDIRYQITEPAIDVDICHCRMCQKATGGQVAAGVTVACESFRFTKGEPKYYKSSPLAERGFCGNCGSSLLYRPLLPQWSDWINVMAASLDNPEILTPTWHLGVESQMPWLDIRDNLPRVRCADSPSLIEAWGSVELPVP